MNYVWMVCRITRNPDSLDIQRDYYFEEDSWAPMHLANRYTTDETYLVLTLIYRLYDECTDPYTTYAPCKVAQRAIRLGKGLRKLVLSRSIHWCDAK